jgi:uncharacterized protein (DUF433 family)
LLGRDNVICDAAHGVLFGRGAQTTSMVHRGVIAVGEFTRITQNAAVMGGKPCIRGMRVTVGMIVAQIGAGLTIDQLLADYPYLDRDDILEALRYAAWRAQEREIALADS